MSNILASASNYLKKVLPPRPYDLIVRAYHLSVKLFILLKAGVRSLYCRLLSYKRLFIWSIYPLLPKKKFRLYPKLVSIFLTTKCNLRCYICRPDGFKGSNLKMEDLKKLKDVIKHGEIVELTGWGEAFLYPKLEEALNYIYSINPRNDLIQINTNGTLLSRKMARLLSGHLRLLTISLNAAKPETYRRFMKYDFEKTLSAIKGFLSELSENDRQKTKMHFVALKQTFREVPDFIILAHELGVPVVSIGNYFVAKKEHADDALLHVKEEYNAVIDRAMELGEKFGIRVEARRFFEEKRNNFYNPDRDCMDPFNSVYISTEGDVAPCCFAGAYSPGNVYGTDFESVWFGEKYQKLRKSRYLPPCKTCTPYIPFDDYNAHFTSQLKDSEEFEEIKKALGKQVCHTEGPK
ncbi:MAG: radical SAM protein [Thermodesulfobacteriota bacterium]